MSWETELNKIFGSGINQNSLEQADALRGAVDVGDLGAFDDELEMVTTAINNQPPAPTAAQNLEQSRRAAQEAVAATEAVHKSLQSVFTEIAFVAARVTRETIGVDPADAGAKGKTNQAKQKIQQLLSTL